MAVMWLDRPEETGNAVHTLRIRHIPAERLREVTKRHDIFLNALETQHIYHCRQCLSLFGGIVPSDEDGNLLVARG